MSIQQNIKDLAAKLAEVKSHCMCVSVTDNGSAFLILYPPGMIIDGARATYKECGKIVALDRLLVVMERHWKQSGIHG